MRFMRRLIAGFVIFMAGCVKRWTKLIIILMIFLLSCEHWTEIDVKIHAPNWTSDNKVVFVKEVIYWRCERIPPIGAENAHIKRREFYLYEINADGTGLKEICLLWDRPAGGIGCLSSAGDWIVFSDNKYQEIWIIKRDGTGLKKVGHGINPDFSPDAEKIVYEKPDSGIWIMNRDGSGDHCIVPDPDAKYPAWSPDDTLVAYVRYVNVPRKWGVHIISFTGDSLRFYPLMEYPRWSASETNIIYCTQYMQGIKIDIISSTIDSLSIRSGQGINPSPDGSWFIAYDGSWFVIKKDGTNKWYLKDKLEGGEK